MSEHRDSTPLPGIAELNPNESGVAELGFDTLDELTDTADRVRRESVGDAVSFAINLNLDGTAISSDPRGIKLQCERIVARVEDLGATELCIQGIPQRYPSSALTLVSALKTVRPQLHIHAFNPEDVAHAAWQTGLTFIEWLQQAKAAGVDTMPGTRARILIDSRRRENELPVSTWVSIIQQAHEIGLRSTATMNYGGGETAGDRLTHLRLLADIQAETGGFTEFIPLPAAVFAPGTDAEHYALTREVVAVARLELAESIDHIQAPWPRFMTDISRSAGPEATASRQHATSVASSGARENAPHSTHKQAARFEGAAAGLITELLNGGADDIGGLLGKFSPAELHRFVQSIGSTAWQRTTTYQAVAS